MQIKTVQAVAIICSITGISLLANSLEVNAQSQEELKKYENGKFGISFQYPSSWGEPLELDCRDPMLVACGHSYIILPTPEEIANATQPRSEATVSPSENATEAALKAAEQILANVTGVSVVDTPSQEHKFGSYTMGATLIELNKPNVDSNPCKCNTLKDFVVWDYIRTPKEGRTSINDNQTIIGNNYSAWQTETDFSDSGNKHFTVNALNGNIGYRFGYSGPADNRFNKHLDEFKNMLKTVTLTSPIPEKKPSFLNSTTISNTSSTGNSIPFLNKSHSVTILHHNSYTDSVGYFHVVGEVENNTPSTAEFVQITGTFYDINNAVVGTQFTYTNPPDISSGETAPFDLTLMSASVPTSLIDHYKLVASYQ